MTNFVGNHDAEQESSVFVDAGGLRRVAGRGDVSQTHQFAIDLLRANVVPAGTHRRVTEARWSASDYRWSGRKVTV